MYKTAGHYTHPAFPVFAASSVFGLFHSAETFQRNSWKANCVEGFTASETPMGAPTADKKNFAYFQQRRGTESQVLRAARTFGFLPCPMNSRIFVYFFSIPFHNISCVVVQWCSLFNGANISRAIWKLDRPMHTPIVDCCELNWYWRTWLYTSDMKYFPISVIVLIDICTIISAWIYWQNLNQNIFTAGLFIVKYQHFSIWLDYSKEN